MSTTTRRRPAQITKPLPPPPPPPSPPPSLWTNRLNTLYLLFFLTHIPIMLTIDLVTLYPPFLTPQILLDLRGFYVEEFRDKFFTEPPGWFLAFLWMEATWHGPVSLWAVWGLWGDRQPPLLPLQLLLFALQTSLTTLTCLVEIYSWDDLDSDAKGKLACVYGPYLAFAAFMGLDMFGRVKARLSL